MPEGCGAKLARYIVNLLLLWAGLFCAGRLWRLCHDLGLRSPEFDGLYAVMSVALVLSAWWRYVARSRPKKTP
jgi:hypothetical protein